MINLGENSPTESLKASFEPFGKAEVLTATDYEFT